MSGLEQSVVDERRALWASKLKRGVGYTVVGMGLIAALTYVDYQSKGEKIKRAAQLSTQEAIKLCRNPDYSYHKKCMSYRDDKK
jgi:hypothetical protein